MQEVKSKAAVLGTLSLGLALAGVLTRSPGAWGACAAWSCLALGMAMWTRMTEMDKSARVAGEIAEREFARGQAESGSASGWAGPPGSSPAATTFKSGALLSMASLVALMASLLAALGSFAVGFLWGALACAPWIALGAWGWSASRLQEEDDASSDL